MRATRLLPRFALPGLLILLRSGTVASQETSVGWEIGPRGILYPDYLADPRRPQISVGALWIVDSDLVDLYEGGNDRLENRLGERFPLVRYTPDSGRAWELTVEGAYFGFFDLKQSIDNVGWDGWYGLGLAWSVAPTWVGQFHYRHLSSQLGDEFIERTGRERVNYTREDITLGLAWEPAPGVALYTEGGVDLYLGSEQQEALFLQFGAQVRREEPSVFDFFGWQAGLDLQRVDVEDFTPEFTAQAALLVPFEREGQSLRIAVEFHTGRVLIGELSDLEETYLGLYFGVDL